jgi:hypothetical protein
MSTEIRSSVIREILTDGKSIRVYNSTGIRVVECEMAQPLFLNCRVDYYTSTSNKKIALHVYMDHV